MKHLLILLGFLFILIGGAHMYVIVFTEIITDGNKVGLFLIMGIVWAVGGAFTTERGINYTPY